MDSRNGKPEHHRRSRSRVSITAFAWGMILVALILGGLGFLTGNGDSAFIWMDVGLCLLVAVVFFVIGLWGCRSHPDRGAPTVALATTAFVVSAVIAIFAPAVKAIVELAEGGEDPPIVIEGECKADPSVPPAGAPPS